MSVTKAHKDAGGILYQIRKHMNNTQPVKICKCLLNWPKIPGDCWQQWLISISLPNVDFKWSIGGSTVSTVPYIV